MKEFMKSPRHVSIIMDGNGRWAKERGLERIEGHKAGKESVRQAIEFAVENKLEFLSLFAFSQENWLRPENEISGLMEMMAAAIIEEIGSFHENGIRLLTIGDKEKLSPKLQEMLRNAENETSANGGLTLVIFLSYSGKWDITQAVRSLAEDIQKGIISNPTQIDESMIDSYLSTRDIPDPDLLIRTSGEKRMSNFLLWQCAYTEFIFDDIFWPDFRKIHFRAALESYGERERRYGKTSDQII